MSDEIKVLAQASIDNLREYARTDPIGFYKTDFDDLVRSHGLSVISSPVRLLSGVFVEPQSEKDKAGSDVENSLKAIELLPGLSPGLAADDRLWTTLALREFREYSRARFPLRVSEREILGTSDAATKAKAKAVYFVTEHMFADTVRRRTRDNAVGRLWWMGHYARRATAGTTREVLNVLLSHDLDIAISFLGRSSIASAPSLADAILNDVVHDEKFATYDSSIRRNAFRAFMRDIDLIAGRRVLSFLSQAEIQPEISELYRTHFSQLSSTATNSS